MLASLAVLLERAGSGKGRLLLATLYLVDMADYDAVNAVWDAWVPAPRRPGLRAGGAPGQPGWRVEIAVPRWSREGLGHKQIVPADVENFYKFFACVTLSTPNCLMRWAWP
jgi:hypothetical protein